MGGIGSRVTHSAACPANTNPKRSHVEAKIFPLLKHPETPLLGLLASKRTQLILSLTQRSRIADGRGMPCSVLFRRSFCDQGCGQENWFGFRNSALQSGSYLVALTFSDAAVLRSFRIPPACLREIPQLRKEL